MSGENTVYVKTGTAATARARVVWAASVIGCKYQGRDGSGFLVMNGWDGKPIYRSEVEFQADGDMYILELKDLPSEKRERSIPLRESERRRFLKLVGR